MSLSAGDLEWGLPVPVCSMFIYYLFYLYITFHNSFDEPRAYIPHSDPRVEFIHAQLILNARLSHQQPMEIAIVPFFFTSLCLFRADALVFWLRCPCLFISRYYYDSRRSRDLLDVHQNDAIEMAEDFALPFSL